MWTPRRIALWLLGAIAFNVVITVSVVLTSVLLAPHLPLLLLLLIVRAGGFLFSRERRWRDLAWIALRSRRYSLAERYARKLLAGADRPFSPRHGAAERHHDGHRFLGLAALGRGEVEQAKEHLLSSAQVYPGDELLIQGPDLRLARELLARGERDCVIEYLERCESSWSASPSQLASLASSLRAGDAVALPSRARTHPVRRDPVPASPPDPTRGSDA